MARVHRIKVWPVYYEAIESGEKTFDLRVADRDYRIGDYVQLHAFDPLNSVYLGHKMYRKITYMMKLNVREVAGLSMSGACFVLAYAPFAPYEPVDGPDEIVEPADV